MTIHREDLWGAQQQVLRRVTSYSCLPPGPISVNSAGEHIQKNNRTLKGGDTLQHRPVTNRTLVPKLINSLSAMAEKRVQDPPKVFSTWYPNGHSDGWTNYEQSGQWLL